MRDVDAFERALQEASEACRAVVTACDARGDSLGAAAAFECATRIEALKSAPPALLRAGRVGFAWVWDVVTLLLALFFCSLGATALRQGFWALAAGLGLAAFALALWQGDRYFKMGEGALLLIRRLLGRLRAGQRG